MYPTASTPQEPVGSVASDIQTLSSTLEELTSVVENKLYGAKPVIAQKANTPDSSVFSQLDIARSSIRRSIDTLRAINERL